jgi:hypothetical protein
VLFVWDQHCYEFGERLKMCWRFLVLFKIWFLGFGIFCWLRIYFVIDQSFECIWCGDVVLLTCARCSGCRWHGRLRLNFRVWYSSFILFIVFCKSLFFSSVFLHLLFSLTISSFISNCLRVKLLIVCCFVISEELRIEMSLLRVIISESFFSSDCISSHIVFVVFSLKRTNSDSRFACYVFRLWKIFHEEM